MNTNKIHKTLIIGFTLATFSCASYSTVKRISDEYHTITIPMQQAAAFSQNINGIITCFEAGATSKDVYDKTVHFITHLKAQDPSGVEILPDSNYVQTTTIAARNWVREFFAGYSQEQLQTSEPSQRLVELCEPLENKTIAAIDYLTKQYDKPYLFWK